MATKEVMVTAPLAVFLFDRTFIAGSFSAAWRARRGYYLTLAATWTLLGWLVLRGEGARGVAAGFGLGVSTWSYLLKQCEALVLYVRLSLWPHPLVLDYGTGVVHSPAEVWWQGLLVVAALAVTVWALVRRPVTGFVGACFFLVLAPSSSLVPLVTQTMAEHRMYLPLAALIIPVVVLTLRRFGRPAACGLGAIAVVFALGTFARNRDYRDAVTIWTTSVTAYPSSARAHNNLATALQAARRPDEANAHFTRAVALDPAYVSARYNWGVALLEQGRSAEAITQLETAVRLVPGHADARVNLGNALMRARRPADAVGHYEEALRLQPAADVHYNLGVALAELNRDAEAIVHFRATLEGNPDQPEAHFQLGRILERSSRPAEAEAEYTAAVRLAPDHVAAHRKLGLMNARRENLGVAAEHFRAVIGREPSDADAHANLGNVLLLQGQPREAIARYEEALRLRPDDPRTRENLRLAREALP
jgi:tetratricopeptide (TPR) repeat protein